MKKIDDVPPLKKNWNNKFSWRGKESENIEREINSTDKATSLKKFYKGL